MPGEVSRQSRSQGLICLDEQAWLERFLEASKPDAPMPKNEMLNQALRLYQWMFLPASAWLAGLWLTGE